MKKIRISEERVLIRTTFRETVRKFEGFCDGVKLLSDQREEGKLQEKYLKTTGRKVSQN